MASEISGTTGQAPAESQPQAGTPANPQAGAANNSNQTNQQAAQKSADEYERMIADLRKENASHRTKLSTFEKQQQEAEAAKLTDIERLQKQHETVSKQAETYRAKLASMAVQIEAQRIGIVDPEVAATLIQSKLEYGEDGTPKNAAELLAELAKAKPYLVGQPAGQVSTPPPINAGGATNPSRSGTNGGAKAPLSHDYIDQLIASNTPEYVARGSEIRAWLLAHPKRGQR